MGVLSPCEDTIFCLSEEYDYFSLIVSGIVYDDRRG